MFWSSTVAVGVLLLGVGAKPEISTDSAHYASCEPLVGGCNNGPLVPWLLHITSAGSLVALQVIVYALAAAVFSGRALTMAPALRRPWPAAALTAVLLSPAFTSWQDAVLTEGLALSCAVLFTSCIPGVLNDKRPWPDFLLACSFLLALALVRSAAALYGVLLLVVLLCVRAARPHTRLTSGHVFVIALSAILVAAIALPVTLAHAERYQSANARKRDLRLLAQQKDSRFDDCALTDVTSAGGCRERVRLWSEGRPSVMSFALEGGLQDWATTALPDQIAFRDIRLPDVAGPYWPATAPQPVRLTSDTWAFATRLVLPIAWTIGLFTWGRGERNRRHLLGWRAPIGLVVLGSLATLPWMAGTWLVDPYEGMRHAMPWSLVAVCLLPALAEPIGRPEVSR